MAWVEWLGLEMLKLWEAKAYIYFEANSTHHPALNILAKVIFYTLFLAHGKLVDATQEFIAQGMSNLVGSFFHSMPVAASFGRTAVNSASSAKTTLVIPKLR